MTPGIPSRVITSSGNIPQDGTILNTPHNNSRAIPNCTTRHSLNAIRSSRAIIRPAEQMRRSPEKNGMEGPKNGGEPIVRHAVETMAYSNSEFAVQTTVLHLCR
jgi:hypothetical protein